MWAGERSWKGLTEAAPPLGDLHQHQKQEGRRAQSHPVRETQLLPNHFPFPKSKGRGAASERDGDWPSSFNRHCWRGGGGVRVPTSCANKSSRSRGPGGGQEPPVIFVLDENPQSPLGAFLWEKIGGPKYSTFIPYFWEESSSFRG